jgi:hypothetical protein
MLDPAEGVLGWLMGGIHTYGLTYWWRTCAPRMQIQRSNTHAVGSLMLWDPDRVRVCCGMLNEGYWVPDTLTPDRLRGTGYRQYGGYGTVAPILLGVWVP